MMLKEMTNQLKKKMSIHILVNLINQYFLFSFLHNTDRKIISFTNQNIERERERNGIYIDWLKKSNWREFLYLLEIILKQYFLYCEMIKNLPMEKINLRHNFQIPRKNVLSTVCLSINSATLVFYLFQNLLFFLLYT
jgi:hypothetical protein